MNKIPTALLDVVAALILGLGMWWFMDPDSFDSSRDIVWGWNLRQLQWGVIMTGATIWAIFRGDS